MPPMPTNVGFFACALTVPFVTSFILSIFLTGMSKFDIDHQDMIVFLDKMSIVFSGLFIFSIPSLLAFWGKHPQRMKILISSFLFAWMIIPYFIIFYWALKKPKKEIPPPEKPKLVHPNFPSLSLSTENGVHEFRL